MLSRTMVGVNDKGVSSIEIAIEVGCDDVLKHLKKKLMVEIVTIATTSNL